MNPFTLIKRKLRVRFGKDIGVIIPDPVEERPEIEYVEPTTWHFRCPECASGHYMTVLASGKKNIHLSQDETLQNLKISSELSCNIEDLDNFCFSTIRESHCVACGKSSPRWQWHDAYLNPHKYFDMEEESLCHCGGELYMERIERTKKYGMVCDRCEWVKPNVTISGSSNITEGGF